MIIFEPSDCLYWTTYLFNNAIIINLDANIPSTNIYLDTNISNRLPINANIYLPDDIIHLEDNLQEEAFFNYIFSNDTQFVSFMNMIDILYAGKDIIVVTKPDSLLGDLLSSLITHRYGYRCIIINEPEDVMPLISYIEDEKGSFSLPGLACLDKDKDRYAYLITEAQLRSAGEL